MSKKRITTSNGNDKAVFLKDRYVINGKRYDYNKSLFLFKKNKKIIIDDKEFYFSRTDYHVIKRRVNGRKKKTIIIVIGIILLLLISTVVAYGYVEQQKIRDKHFQNNFKVMNYLEEVAKEKAKEIKEAQTYEKEDKKGKKIIKEITEIQNKKFAKAEKKKKQEIEEEKKAEEEARKTNELKNEKVYEYQKSVAKEIENSDEYKAIQGKFKWNGSVLGKSNGVVKGPHGRETYYNLPMGGVINIMRGLGNKDKYWVRSDGCKMLGNYIMVAAKVDATHKRGRIIKCSRGFAIVCDTGSFLSKYPNGVDVAVNW